MKTVTVHPGDVVIDYSGWRNYEAMVQMGVKCVMRYLSTVSSGALSWKSIGPQEVAELFKRGIGISLMWERAATTPLGGRDVGLADGHIAALNAARLGYPPGLPIDAAVDIDVTKSNIAACTAYMEGFHEGLGGQYVTGLYGDVDIIKACPFVGFRHLVGATSWSHGEKLADVHVRQTIFASSTNYDNNIVIRPFEMWLPSDDPAPIPTPPEEDVSPARIITLNGFANAYLLGAGPVTYLTGEVFSSLVAAGVEIVAVEPSDLALDSWGIERADLEPLR